MAVDIKKYNPGFLTDDNIVASFCVRTGELQSLLESLRGNTGNSNVHSNVHSLVIGPRGSGKTHLLLRVAAEVRRDPSLAGSFPSYSPKRAMRYPPPANSGWSAWAAWLTRPRRMSAPIYTFLTMTSGPKIATVT